MKYIIYSSYSRDLSQKIKTAIKMRQKKGQWIGSNAPYGYMKDPNDKNHLVINPDTAPVVRHIFDLALAGVHMAEIARTLNKEGVETKGEYFNRTHPDYKPNPSALEQQFWTHYHIRRILESKLYTGAMVSNTVKWRSVYNKHKTKNDESEWIIVPNCHEAIVTDEEFEKVQQMMKKQGRKGNYPPKDYLLRSLVRCGVCGRILTRQPRKERTYYVCNKSLVALELNCPRGEKFYEDDLENAVTTDLRDKLRLFVDNQKANKGG